MLRFLADEDFNNRIVRGLLRRQPDLDIVRVQDVGLRGASDAVVLAWTAQEERILLTHDVSTVTRIAYERMASGGEIAGVIEVSQSAALGQSIEDLLLIAATVTAQEFRNKIEYLPL